MNIQSDGQVYQLNWGSRLDRRNVDFTAYCSVHTWSRFVLGLHFNFDGRVDPFEINAKAAQRGDLARPEAFRKYAHYWLAGDELRAGRAMLRDDKKARTSLLAQVDALYASAGSRQDVEDIELGGARHRLHHTVPEVRLAGTHALYGLCALGCCCTGYWLEPALSRFRSTRTSIPCPARPFCRCLPMRSNGAMRMRSSSTTPSGQTIDERERILKESKQAQAASSRRCPGAVREDSREVARRLMKVRIEERQKHANGKTSGSRTPFRPWMNRTSGVLADSSRGR